MPPSVSLPPTGLRNLFILNVTPITSEYVVLGEIVDNQCLDSAFKLGGVRIEGAGALQRLVTSTMNKARQNHSTTLVQDLPVPAMCASVYHHISNQQEGGLQLQI